MKLAPLQFRLETLSECPSSQEVLLARRGSADFHGLAVLALRQTAAYGRRGRAWSTGEGNLALSIALEIPDSGTSIALLPFLAGLALFEAAGRYLPSGAILRLKWPNDLYLGGKKLSGLLTQVRQGVNQTEVVLGVGLNLAAVPAGFEADATCIAEFAKAPAPEEFARIFLGLLEKELSRLDDFPSLRTRWESAARLREGLLYIVGEKDPVQPQALLPSGELLVSGAGGKSRKLSSEDVSLRYSKA